MRSLLFVPAHDARKLAKGLEAGADALIVDLEDSVPDGLKAAARQTCAEFVRTNGKRLPIFVRVNALDSGLMIDDLIAVIGARPFGIVLPKAAGGRSVNALGDEISRLEIPHQLQPNGIRILPIVTESAAAVLNMASYRHEANSRLCGLFWGGEDLAADIGALRNRGDDGRYTAPYQLARSLTLLGATAADVPAIDAVYTNFRDAEGLRLEALEGLRDGFSAKVAIHPDQVRVINDVFTPSDVDLDRARQVIAAFEAQPGAGAISLDGRMLDRPHLRAAVRLLSRAQRPNTN